MMHSLARYLPRVREHSRMRDDSHAAIACDMLNPAQCPEHALMARIPLGLGPSLHQLRSRSLCLVRRLQDQNSLGLLSTPEQHWQGVLALTILTAVCEIDFSTHSV